MKKFPFHVLGERHIEFIPMWMFYFYHQGAGYANYWISGCQKAHRKRILDRSEKFPEGFPTDPLGEVVDSLTVNFHASYEKLDNYDIKLLKFFYK